MLIVLDVKNKSKRLKVQATLTETKSDYYGMKICLIVPENFDPKEVQEGFDDMMVNLIERANQLTLRDLYDMNRTLQSSIEAQMN